MTHFQYIFMSPPVELPFKTFIYSVVLIMHLIMHCMVSQSIVPTVIMHLFIEHLCIKTHDKQPDVTWNLQIL